MRLYDYKTNNSYFHASLFLIFNWSMNETTKAMHRARQNNSYSSSATCSAATLRHYVFHYREYVESCLCVAGDSCESLTSRIIRHKHTACDHANTQT